ncbi:MAG: NlpC/P60 family protein [Planctomycetes bacterium]|nr:NlpC/P60 family protein [Planctomycetota bacterium]
MPDKIPKIIFSLLVALVILQTFSFLFINLWYNPTQAAESKITNPFDKMNVEIPGLKEMAAQYPVVCEKNSDGKTTSCKMTWIAVYIASIYKYAIGVVGILATVVMMLGGIMWIVAGGNATRIGEAKSWITAAVTGLILALSSYLILAQINPALVGYSALSIDVVKEIEGDNPVPITAAEINNVALSQNIPSGTITDVANSMVGKFTYSQANRGQAGYVDCSSFACIALDRSGYVAPGCTTATMFSANTTIPMDSLKNLQPGDLIGFPPNASKNGNGHVWVSLGNGQFAEARGGEAGRKQGNAIRIVNALSVIF